MGGSFFLFTWKIDVAWWSWVNNMEISNFLLVLLLDRKAAAVKLWQEP